MTTKPLKIRTKIFFNIFFTSRFPQLASQLRRKNISFLYFIFVIRKNAPSHG